MKFPNYFHPPRHPSSNKKGLEHVSILSSHRLKKILPGVSAFLTHLRTPQVNGLVSKSRGRKKSLPLCCAYTRPSFSSWLAHTVHHIQGEAETSYKSSAPCYLHACEVAEPNLHSKKPQLWPSGLELGWSCPTPYIEVSASLRWFEEIWRFSHTCEKPHSIWQNVSTVLACTP